MRNAELDHPAHGNLRFRQERGAESGKKQGFMQQPLAVAPVRPLRGEPAITH
jgi:hypothetical protein